MTLPTTSKNAALLAAAGGIIALWVVVNNPDRLQAGIVYVSMALLVIAVYAGVFK